MSSDIILVNCKITTFKRYLLQKGRIALKIKQFLKRIIPLPGQPHINVQVIVFTLVTPRSDGVLKHCYQLSDLLFSPHSIVGIQPMGETVCIVVLGNNKVFTSLCNFHVCKSWCKTYILL